MGFIGSHIDEKAITFVLLFCVGLLAAPLAGARASVDTLLARCAIRAPSTRTSGVMRMRPDEYPWAWPPRPRVTLHRLEKRPAFGYSGPDAHSFSDGASERNGGRRRL